LPFGFHNEPPLEQCKKIHYCNVKINIAIDGDKLILQNRGNLGKGMQMASVAGFRVSYAKVEAALVQMHNIAPDDVSAFRARFGALQRGGMLGDQPGKGRKLEYGPEQFHRTVLAFELVQAGIAPSIILPLIKEHWDNQLRDIFIKAERASVRETSDVVLILGGVAAISSESAVPNINHVTMAKVSERITFALDGDALPARALLVNLSAQLRKFHDALVHYHLQPEPAVVTTKRQRGKPRAAMRKR
jgi:hypothetical protein